MFLGTGPRVYAETMCGSVFFSATSHTMSAKTPEKTVKGNANYKSGSKTITVTVVVK